MTETEYDLWYALHEIGVDLEERQAVAAAAALERTKDQRELLSQALAIRSAALVAALALAGCGDRVPRDYSQYEPMPHEAPMVIPTIPQPRNAREYENMMRFMERQQALWSSMSASSAQFTQPASPVIVEIGNE